MSEVGENEGNGADDKESTPLLITHQYLKDLSFETPSAPGIYLDPPEGEPDVSIDINVRAERLGDRVFEVVLHFEARASQGEAVFFIVETDYAGIVEVGNVPEEHIRPLVLIEAPRLLFPYVRAIISTATRDGGFPPLMLANVDFVEMYRAGTETESAEA